MSLSRHEQNLALATAFVVAFGLLAMKLRDGLDAWGESLSRLEGLRRNRAEARELIDMGPQWKAQYEKVRKEMPVFERDRQVDTYWMSEMDRLAAEHSVSITRRQVGRETLVGDVYEFSTECQWEAPLDAFAKFLHAMQSAGAMLDVRDLVIRTQERRKGVLRGSFTLYCAYMRGQAEEGESPESEVQSPKSEESDNPVGADRRAARESESPESPEIPVPASEISPAPPPPPVVSSNAAVSHPGTPRADAEPNHTPAPPPAPETAPPAENQP